MKLKKIEKLDIQMSIKDTNVKIYILSFVPVKDLIEIIKKVPELKPTVTDLFKIIVKDDNFYNLSFCDISFILSHFFIESYLESELKIITTEITIINEKNLYSRFDSNLKMSYLGRESTTSKNKVSKLQINGEELPLNYIESFITGLLTTLNFTTKAKNLVKPKNTINFLKRDLNNVNILRTDYNICHDKTGVKIFNKHCVVEKSKNLMLFLAPKIFSRVLHLVPFGVNTPHYQEIDFFKCDFKKDGNLLRLVDLFNPIQKSITGKITCNFSKELLELLTVGDFVNKFGSEINFVTNNKGRKIGTFNFYGKVSLFSYPIQRNERYTLFFDETNLCINVKVDCGIISGPHSFELKPNQILLKDLEA